MRAWRLAGYGVVVALGLLAGVAPAASMAPTAASLSAWQRLVSQSGGLNAGYPRLANYNGFKRSAQVPFFAAYNLVVARRGAPIDQLKQANPNVVTLLYERALQADPRRMGSLYGLAAQDVPGGWWLLGPGSTLPLAIGPEQDWIPVADARLFSPCQDVLVDDESMHILEIEGNWLHVDRGYYSRTAWHRQGARVAPHLSYRMDISNCRYGGTTPRLRPWSLNLSSLCPRWHGQTWADFLAHHIADVVRSEGWSGVFYDNLTDFPFSALVDSNNDGRADGGVVGGINVWRQGEQELLAETRRLLRHQPVLINGDLALAGLADGREMEGFPLIPGLALAAGIDAYLADAAAGSPLTIVNPDNVDRGYPTPESAQLAVGVALLGDGYAAYDQGWLRHGASWWFDAFDNGAGSALQSSVGAWTAQLPVAHPWRFKRGDVIMMDAEAAWVAKVTPHTLVVERGMYGTAAAPHPAYTVVTTAWQRSVGHGYLGLPLGPAQAEPTGPWSTTGVSVTVLSSTGVALGRLLHPIKTIVEPGAALNIVSAVHYDAGATGLSLYAPAPRPGLSTLIFSARGPAGQAMEVADGHASAAVTLWPQWHQYVLPIGGDGHIDIGTGRIGGAVGLRDLRVLPTQQYVLRRDFTHGAVLVNPTDLTQNVALRQPYRLLSGDGTPNLNTGALTCGVRIGAYRALILLSAPGARCPVPAPHARSQARRHTAKR